MALAAKKTKPGELACPEGVAHCDFLVELAALRRELADLAQEVRTDALTGLFNFRHFSELLEQELERSRRNGLPLALVMVDLDRFKRINDRWGHEVGNRVLRHVSGLLRGGVRRIDSVCRYGGEELVLLLPGIALPKAARVAERLRSDIQDAPLVQGEQSIRITASFGVAVFPDGGAVDGGELVRQADAMLYRAKAEGRNCVRHPPVAPRVPASQVTADEKKALLE